ncbi:MAG: energy-coupled thiamine transporter ThiT [Peptoniphilaceae bacterium]|nr:energy-coupled thiamine transporter ThiT [Peptoniphilaceae bacterium]MDY6018713.1 energy-coupled thiamine transporter ThiT [Anaerococcus sp.]
MNNKNTRMIVEAGICIALSTILSFIKLFELPLGGSVTLAARLPLVIFAIRWGFKKGIVAGAIFGLVQIALGGYVIHPVQGFLDYVVSYGFMGLSGIRFSKNFSKTTFIPSVILAYLFSGAANVLSGMIYFYDMTTAVKYGFHSFLVYNLAYNYSFLVLDCAILLLILVLTFDRLKNLYSLQA